MHAEPVTAMVLVTVDGCLDDQGVMHGEAAKSGITNAVPFLVNGCESGHEL